MTTPWPRPAVLVEIKSDSLARERRLRTSRRRRVACGLFVFWFTMTSPFGVRPAEADLFGADVAALAAIGKQLWDTYVQVQTQVRQGAMMIQLIKDGGKALTNPRSIEDVVNLYDRSKLYYANATSDVASLGRNAVEVQARLAKLTPGLGGGKSLRNLSNADFQRFSTGWDEEMHRSAETAMRLQANAQMLEEQARSAVALIDASQRNPSQVAQLQVIAGSLGLLQTKLDKVIDLLSANGRVTSAGVLKSESDEALARERSRRVHAGFATPLAPGGPVPKSIHQ